ncbi:PRI3-like protein [Schizophyllum fasciatum]
MKFTTSVLVLALFASVIAGPLDARDADVPEDREKCGLKDAQNHEGECNDQTAQQCWSSGGDCTYNEKTKRCSNGTKMRGTDASLACQSCQCSAR